MPVISQARQMFENLEAILKMVDADMTRGLKATCYLTNIEDAEIVLKVWQEEFICTITITITITNTITITITTMIILCTRKQGRVKRGKAGWANWGRYQGWTS